MHLNDPLVFSDKLMLRANNFHAIEHSPELFELFNRESIFVVVANDWNYMNSIADGICPLYAVLYSRQVILLFLCEVTRYTGVLTG